MQMGSGTVTVKYFIVPKW